MTQRFLSVRPLCNERNEDRERASERFASRGCRVTDVRDEDQMFWIKRPDGWRVSGGVGVRVSAFGPFTTTA